jgi:carotenoid cleavage dioxygenase-like enzyme
MMETTAAATTPFTARKGFESLADETRIDSLPVRGAMPPWLGGSLIRTGPAKWEVGERSMNHWFDGLAMLHRFSFDGGGVAYANRFLETRAYRAARDTGQISYSEFATDPCRSLFQRVTSVFSPKISDNANVNLVKLGERFIAMTETPIPVQFDPDTLAAAGVPYQAPGQLTTAHPHMDRASGGMLNYAAKLGPRSTYRFFLLRPGADSPEQIGSAPVREPAYMHSFGLTPRWLVLAEFPFVVNPPSIVLSGRPYIENFRWKPERATRFHLFDRSSGQVSGPFTTDARFAFHHVNAFEEGDDVVVDVCTYPDPRVVQDLYLSRLRAGEPVQSAHLERFRLAPARDGEVTSERLLEEPLELARINYFRSNERPYRYVWGVGMRDGWLGSIVKGDLVERTSAVWSEDGCYPGEPVFVGRPHGAVEDDGVLLSVVLDARSERSFLLVLDAGSLEELARAEVPHHIPFGFHGQFSK